MEFEGKKSLNSNLLKNKLSSWSLIRTLQLALGLFCFGYFYQHPMEWITLIIGLALSIQAIFNIQMGCASGACRRRV